MHIQPGDTAHFMQASVRQRGLMCITCDVPLWCYSMNFELEPDLRLVSYLQNAILKYEWSNHIW